VSVLAPLDPIWYPRARVKQKRRARTVDERRYAAELILVDQAAEPVTPTEPIKSGDLARN
jgi:hypothetical protein